VGPGARTGGTPRDRRGRCPGSPVRNSKNLQHFSWKRKLGPPISVEWGVARIEPGFGVDELDVDTRSQDHVERSVMMSLDDRTWQALNEEAAREGLTVEELVTFSALYYLADLDSGRIARRVSLSPYPGPTSGELEPQARITRPPAAAEAPRRSILGARNEALRGLPELPRDS
jgi:hypothetical protein